MAERIRPYKEKEHLKALIIVVVVLVAALLFLSIVFKSF